MTLLIVNKISRIIFHFPIKDIIHIILINKQKFNIQKLIFKM